MRRICAATVRPIAPKGVDAYSILRLVEDGVGILDAFGRKRVFVVGPA